MPVCAKLAREQVYNGHNLHILPANGLYIAFMIIAIGAKVPLRNTSTAIKLAPGHSWL